MNSKNPELDRWGGAGEDGSGLIIFDQEKARQRREAWAKHMAMVAATAPVYGAAAVAARTEAEQASEEALVVGSVQQDLATAQRDRAAAQREVDRITLLLDRARALARSIGREAVHAERIVDQARATAVEQLVQQLAEGETDPTIPAPMVTNAHDAGRLAVATEAVERLERELATAEEKVAGCDWLCRRHAVAVLLADAVGMARAIQRFEAAIADQRLSLASLIAVLTDVQRPNPLLLPGRVHRVLHDHADRLVASLDRGPWLARLAELVAGNNDP